MRTVLSVLGPFLLLSLAGPSALRGQCDWQVSPHQGRPGLEGALCTVRYDPDGAGPAPLMLVVAGGMHAAGVLPASNIAAYDGDTWSTFGLGLGGGGINGSAVRALAVYNGDLIAAGDFTTAGGQTASRIARWDGASWNILGGGLNDSVFSLAVHNGELYAAGLFTTAGGAPANRIARWDGSAWNPVGPGAGGLGGGSARIFCMTSFNGFLWAGGDFTSAGGVPVGNLACWNGSAWSNPGAANGVVRGIGFHQPSTTPGTLYISGEFTSVGGTPANFIARYSGLSGAWSAMGAGLPGGGGGAVLVRGTGPFSHEVLATAYAAGGRILRWTGTTWNEVGTPWGPVTPSALDFYNGQYITCSTRVHFFDAPHNAWAPLGPGVDGHILDAAALGGDLFFAGTFGHVSNQRCNRVVRWDGTGFFPMAGGVNGFANALAVFEGSLYTGGQFTSAGSAFTTSVARWNGADWEPAGGGLPTTAVVNSLAVHDGELYLGGTFSGGARVRRWDGSAWQEVGAGLTGAVMELRSYGGVLFAGGGAQMATAGAVSSALARFNAAADLWEPIPLPTTSSAPDVRGMEVFGGALYVGGLALGSEPLPTRFYGLVRLSGPTAAPEILTEIRRVTINETNAINSLMVYENALHISGTFDMAAGQPAAGFARFDGAAWTPLGEGVAGSPFESMAVYADELIIAGGIESVGGGRISHRWARWRCPGGPAACYANCDNSTVAPILNVADFTCFLQRFAAGEPSANCDQSTTPPVLNVADFTCFLQRFAAGCP